jgi:hypothetical protein
MSVSLTYLSVSLPVKQTTAICVKPKPAGGAPEDGAAGGDAGNYENTVDTTE